MADPRPIWLGNLEPGGVGDTVDHFIDLDGHLPEGETITGVELALLDTSGDEVVGAVGTPTITSPRFDFQITHPAAAGLRTLRAYVTVDDGQRLTRKAGVRTA